MSNPGKSFNAPPAYSVAGPSLRQDPIGHADPRVPLLNLSTVRTRMDSLQCFLSQSVNTNTLLPKDQMNLVSSEIASAIHQIIVNGAALLSCVQTNSELPDLRLNFPAKVSGPPADSNQVKKNNDMDFDDEGLDQENEEECEIVELDAVELLAEHIHFCDICGKGFKRDANLRMHMRAHGNQYKTPEALTKKAGNKGKQPSPSGRKTRFSCPYDGCNRNKKHRKFRPLKSVICVRNHFKRSHCPKMYSCNRCHKKNFSVLADLKSHLKHCGGEEKKWKCTCGNSFSRKDKLFGHMALFEGHMPAVLDDDDGDNKLKDVVAMEEDEEREAELRDNFLDDGFFDGLLDGFDSIESYCLQGLLGSHNRL